MNEMKAYQNAVEHGIVSASAIDKYLWDVERYLMRKYGCDTAERDIAPLKWYITTGRASTVWLRMLLEKYPYNVAKKLHNSGSYAQALHNIDEYIGWCEYVRKELRPAIDEYTKAKEEFEAMFP